MFKPLFKSSTPTTAGPVRPLNVVFADLATHFPPNTKSDAFNRLIENLGELQTELDKFEEEFKVTRQNMLNEQASL
jgi:hypothetical protein